ncbi:MAG: DUF4365 domain-containing protein [Coleofasciculus chthonoplastes F3-SA18-01]|uniref:DUF4365 domain-containing protein n=1 Tax=Coleofasciculus TaxID=669368 RepID=UPI003304D364
MDINQRKEQFSYAYIYAVASTAGYSFQIAAKPMDFDGIDIILAGGSGTGIIRYPRLELQVKCTSVNLVSHDIIRYSLPLKNYNDLRVENVQTPRLLVVIVVPDKLDNWLTQSPQELCLKYCGYWISLRGQPPTSNQTTITISIPCQNIFNVEALTTLMQRIEAGETL